MLDILTLCLDDTGAQRLATLLDPCPADIHQLAGLHGLDALQQSPDLARAQLLLISVTAPSAEQLASLEQLLDAHPQLSALLLCDSLHQTPLLAAMRAGISSVLFWPLSPDNLQHELARLARKVAPPAAQRQGQVLAFISAKGGAGSTFIACNLAHALSQHGRVLLLDLNRQFADADLYLGERQTGSTVRELFAQADRLDAGLLKACVHNIQQDLDLLVGPGDPIQGASLLAEPLPKILTLAREQYEFVVIELGQSIDALTIAALDQAQQIFTVLRQDLLHLYAGKRLLDILQELGYRRDQVQLLVNCFDKSAPINLKSLQEAMEIRQIRTLSDDPAAARRSQHEGRLLQQVAPRCRLLRELTALAAECNPQPVTAETGSWLPWRKAAAPAHRT